MAVTVGVICAIPQELAYLRGVLVDAKRQQVAQILFDSGQLDAHRVVLAAAGMGKVNTGLTATLLADRFGCRTIVFTGVAGGLDPELCIGDIVIADRVVQHDFGLLTDERLRPYQPGHIPFIEPTERLGYPVDPAVIDRVKHRLDGFTLAPLSTAAGGGGRQPRIYYGTILTGDQYLHCERTRNRLHHELGGGRRNGRRCGGANLRVLRYPMAGHSRALRSRRSRFGGGLQSVCRRGGGQFGPRSAALAAGVDGLLKTTIRRCVHRVRRLR